MEDGINSVEARFEGIDQREFGLEEELSKLSHAVKERLARLETSCKGELDKLRSLFEEEMGRMNAVHERQVNSMLQQMEEMRANLALCKKACATGPAPTVVVEARRVGMPKTKSYAGAHNARDVDNFLCGLEQYYGAAGITEDAIKVQTATLYLTNTSMLW